MNATSGDRSRWVREGRNTGVIEISNLNCRSSELLLRCNFRVFVYLPWLPYDEVRRFDHDAGEHGQFSRHEEVAPALGVDFFTIIDSADHENSKRFQSR